MLVTFKLDATYFFASDIQLLKFQSLLTSSLSKSFSSLPHQQLHGRQAALPSLLKRVKESVRRDFLAGFAGSELETLELSHRRAGGAQDICGKICGM